MISPLGRQNIGGPYPSLLSAISSRKATGRRAKLGNLGIVGYCLPPSHLGYSSILDSTRFGVGSSELDSAQAAPLIAFSDIVATRHSTSKLASALAAPLIPATEPESHPCYPQEIPGQARDESLRPLTFDRY